GAHDNIIGGNEPGTGNIISGNGAHGMFIGSSFNTIQGNYIGVNVFGNAPLGNGQPDMALDQGDGIRIVTSEDDYAEGNYIVNNVISANTVNGIGIFSSDRNIIKNNFIGTDKDGNVDGLGNKNSGIKFGQGPIIDNAVENVIGGQAKTDCNTIAGNFSFGIELGPADHTTIEGNLIY
ncbi:MAG: hypothetical protein P8Z35_24335, partial [Ignavibacteriaceae bacterium]